MMARNYEMLEMYDQYRHPQYRQPQARQQNRMWQQNKSWSQARKPAQSLPTSRSSIKTVAFTGHRPEKLPWGTEENSAEGVLFKFRLRETLEYLIVRGYTDFLSGATRGFDTIAAEMVISLREIYPWIRLTVVLPCADQARKWEDADRARWENIVTNSDHVETMQASFDRGCMFKRNRYLVDHADLVLACYNGDPHSGTGMTVNYAHKKDVKVRRLRLEKK